MTVSSPVISSAPSDLDSRYIGHIDIRDDHSLVDLPEGMPPDLLQQLRRARIRNKPSRMQLVDGEGPAAIRKPLPRAKGKAGRAARPAGKGKPAHRKDRF